MSRVVELRQYTLKPGRRDDLIALFEREFVESQEAVGIDLIGTFHDADDLDRFVWLRGFPDMESRARSLAAFYGGPVWKANRNAANDTMIDSDNVLLLSPAWPGAEFHKTGRREVVTASIHYFGAPVTEEAVAMFRDLVTRETIAACVTETGPNSFPALPVREGENVFVIFGPFGTLPMNLSKQLAKPVETLRLIPTARSRL